MTSDRKRLLLVSPIPPPMGGIATWTQAVMRSPLADRFELRVIDTSPSEHASVSGGSRLRLDRVGHAVRILAAVLRELVSFRPHIVHVNTSYFWAFLRDGLSAWIAKAFRARVLLHFRGGDFPEFVEASRPLVRRTILATLRRVDRLIALTHPTRSFLEPLAREGSVRYLPNFVALEDFGAVPDRAARTARPEILFVGWLIEGKGVCELLEAAKRIRDARFTLIGPADTAFGPRLRNALEGLEDHVRVLPPRARREILELYREADIFVLPTWREGFPNVVLEAMAAGLPVVATPVGAIPDAVCDGREGLLVPPRDAGALTAALEKLVHDRALRLAMGSRARARVELEFSLPAVLEKLGAVYEELLVEEP